MKMLEVKDALVDRFKELLSPHGFRAKKGLGGFSFVRKFDGGAHKIACGITNYNPTYDISCFVGIRIDEAGKMFNHVSGCFDEKKPDDRFNTNTKLAYFSGQPFRYTVVSMEDIDALVAYVSPILLERVIPFLDQIFTVQSLDKVFNAEDDPTFSPPSIPYGAMNSLIVAHLAGNKNYDRLLALYESRAVGQVDLNRRMLKNCTDYLAGLRSPAADKTKM